MHPNHFFNGLLEVCHPTRHRNADVTYARYPNGGSCGNRTLAFAILPKLKIRRIFILIIIVINRPHASAFAVLAFSESYAGLIGRWTSLPTSSDAWCPSPAAVASPIVTKFIIIDNIVLRHFDCAADCDLYLALSTCDIVLPLGCRQTQTNNKAERSF